VNLRVQNGENITVRVGLEILGRLILGDAAVYDEVLAARADRVAMVRDFLAAVTAEELAEQRPNPHAPDYQETVRSCLHTILEEEWEHQRYAVRDLDRIAARSSA
jgi:hypothetical protein